MVVGDLDAVGVAVSPNKTDTPLLIDADAVLSRPVVFEGLEAVAGRYAQRVKAYRCAENKQLTEGDALQLGGELTRMPTTENFFGFSISKPP